MNKPAAKEPSMDEILSSIRQIISDEDEGAPEDASKEEITKDDAMHSEPELATNESQTDEGAEEALELKSEQIVKDESDELEFNPVEQNAPIEKQADDLSDLVVPDDISFDDEVKETTQEVDIEQNEPEQPSAPAPSMPDPNLADEMTDKLLEPATETLVSNAFAQLGTLGFNDKDLTVENMIRQMLRPMLKDWLNENLPSIVEKMVRKEVERLSRGG